MSSISPEKPGGMRSVEIKRMLREIDLANYINDNGSMGSTQTGWMECIEVDWPALDKAIDEFCAEFRNSTDGRK